jgi:hypothetical protein
MACSPLLLPLLQILLSFRVCGEVGRSQTRSMEQLKGPGHAGAGVHIHHIRLGPKSPGNTPAPNRMQPLT